MNGTVVTPKKEASAIAKVPTLFFVYTFFFIRDAFIRDEMMSTENLGKIRASQYSTS